MQRTAIFGLALAAALTCAPGAAACDSSPMPLTPLEKALSLKKDAAIRDKAAKVLMVYIYSPSAPACCHSGLFGVSEWRTMPAAQKAQFLQNMNYEEDEFFARYRNVRTATPAYFALHRRWQRERKPRWQPIGYGHREYPTCSGPIWDQTRFTLPDIRTWPRQPDGTFLAEVYGYKYSDRANGWNRDFVVLSYHLCEGPFDASGHCPR